MTFRVHVEHEVIGGETVLEKFEGVQSFNNPPMVSTLHLSFEDDDRDMKKLNYGRVVRAVDEDNNE